MVNEFYFSQYGKGIIFPWPGAAPAKYPVSCPIDRKPFVYMILTITYSTVRSCTQIAIRKVLQLGY